MRWDDAQKLENIRGFMGYPTKIATCCYCGTRAALVLGKDRHELSCSSCGAPLHDMKRLRTSQSGERRKRVESHPDWEQPRHRCHPRDREAWEPKHPKRRKYKKRKGLMRKIMEEAFDVIEDIFD